MEDMKTYWVTQYALTSGIEKVQGGISGNFIRVEGGWGFKLYRLGTESHETREAAVICAKEMQKKKIASLKKSIQRIENLEFGEAT